MGIFVLIKLENKLDVVISQVNFISKDKFALKLIDLVTIPNLFPLKVVQKYQNCVFRENSNKNLCKVDGRKHQRTRSLNSSNGCIFVFKHKKMLTKVRYRKYIT